MIAKLQLSLPWLFLVAVLGAIIWDQARPRSVENLDSTAAHTDRATAKPDSKVAQDPVCGMTVRKAASDSVSVSGHAFYFCSNYCRDDFKADLDKWVGPDSAAVKPPGVHTMRGVPTWLLQLGVGFVILISFGCFEGVANLPRRALAAARPARPARHRWEITAWAPLRRCLQWPYTRPVAQAVTSAAFLFVIAAGLFGNQNPAMNIAPLLTWTLWWVGLVFLVLFLGKAWCTVCPWDAIATWTEKLRIIGPRESGLGLDLHWPKVLRNIWPAVGLFVLLTWIELGAGITLIPRATAYVALLILGMAVASIFLFERKAFCRYACLVGRISGLYSLFSSLELRTRDQEVCSTCKTSDCYKGNEKGDGCPTFEFPRTLELNTYCTLCTECLKTCPHDNIAINFRPWASDLLGKGKPRSDEAILALILLSMTGFHGLTMTPKWAEWNRALQAEWNLPEWLTFSLLMAAIMLAPVFIFWALTRLAAFFSGRQEGKVLFLEYAYALLPIALFYHLAHNAEHFLMEGPKILALLSDPFGWGWNLFGTAQWQVGPLVTLSGLWMIQVAMVLIGHVYSLWITERTTRRLIPARRAAFYSQLPMLAAMVLFSVFSLWLLNQPMQMRVSAM